MKTLKDILSIESFSIESIDVSEIHKIANMLPRNGIADTNIAERGLIYTLEGQNLCQEKIAQLDVWISRKESICDKSYSLAALEKAKNAGHKTAKEKEWFAQADDDYINAQNDVAIAKACRRWFENKASYFSAWHYALKTFLRRDYELEGAATINTFNIPESSRNFPKSRNSEDAVDDMSGEIEWSE